MSESSNGPLNVARLGEVIETNTLGYWAESDQLHRLPEFGQLVRANLDDQITVYGVVTFGETGGIDPGRRAVRRGDNITSDELIYGQHPELELVLRTIFRVAAIGFVSGLSIEHRLPPLPVPLHYSVHACDLEAVRFFCVDPGYLPTLLAYRGEVTPEAAIAAHLRWVDRIVDDEHQWLLDATRRLARLMKRDYDELVSVLESIDPGE